MRGPVIWTTVMTILTLVVVIVTYFSTCLAEIRENGPPVGYLWSPKARFCGIGGISSTAPWICLSLLLPLVALALALYIRRRTGLRDLVRLALALAILGPIAPPIYAAALPSYQVNNYPILTQPWLRVATPTRPARVCYVYGIVTALSTNHPAPSSMLRCVDLRRNAASRELTPHYDEGVTSYNLQFLGDALTREGWPAPAGFSGFADLIVARAYELPFNQVRQDSTNVSA